MQLQAHSARMLRTGATTSAGVAVPRHVLVRRRAPSSRPFVVRSNEARSEPAVAETMTDVEEAAAKAAETLGSGVDASEPAAASTSKADSKDTPSHLSWKLDPNELAQLDYAAPSQARQTLTNIKLAFALPWRRFKKEAVLTCKLEGDISDQLKGRFAPGTSMPQLCDALEKAAYDPRIVGICFEIGPLGAGWAKLQELRKYIELFKKSGKFSMALMKNAGEKEYYLATAFEEIYVPPSASIRLNGFSVGGTFLRGVLDKVGVEPQVKRIGKYKSAGDQLLRTDMSEAQREQLSALVDGIYEEFVTEVAKARGKTREDVIALLDEGVFDMSRLAADGWVTGLKYEDEVTEDLKARTGRKEKEQLRRVGVRKYSSVGRSAFGLHGKKRIAVLRAGGAILGSSGGASSASGSITPDAIIPKLRALGKDKGIAAVVLRVDSPGGDALASDLMWREIQVLAKKKPVIASMGDVAASGGYYMSMGCQKIVAEPLTITGSIGVVTGKFNLKELFERVGYNKELISRGRYAELLAADQRSFTEEEEELFDRAADFAYRSFRDKAAASRAMDAEAMQDVAQGRVWLGQTAIQKGLVDMLGGISQAVAVAKQAAGIPKDENVTVVEVSRAQTSPLALLGGGASMATAFAALAAGSSPAAALQQTMGLAVLQSLVMGPNGLSIGALGQLVQQVTLGRPLCLMTEVDSGSLVGSVGVSSDAGSNMSVLSEGGSEEEWSVWAPFELLEGLVEELM